MGCCNEPVSLLTGAAPDPTQHVHYARGMVLGVDDFVQEFTYLDGRDRWHAREAIGYGTLSGLQVSTELDGAQGPRLHVSAGSALTPSGRHLWVPADQCAVLNRWLAKPENAAMVNRLLNPGAGSPPLPTSPPSGSPAMETGAIALALTLCWSDCQTRPVPIPGAPCRSDEALMAPSRIADDFRLELREVAPQQTEEDALRDYVRWLRANVSVSSASPGPVADDIAWIEALRPGIQPWRDAAAASPPVPSPISVETVGDYLFDLAAPVQVGSGDLCNFLRVALRFWVTELRPMWMALRGHQVAQGDADCVLLAVIHLDVQWIGGSPAGAWQVVGSPPMIGIDERQRPVLAHLRFLQEWALCGCDCGEGGGFGTAPAGGGSGGGGGGGGGGAPIAGPVLVSPIGRPPLPTPIRRPDPLTPPVPLPGPGPVAAAPTVAPLRLPLVRVSHDLTLDDSHSYVLARDAQAVAITLPASDARTEGRVYVVKNINVPSLTLQADGATGDRLDDQAQLSIAPGRAVTVIADGAGHWHDVGDVAVPGALLATGTGSATGAATGPATGTTAGAAPGPRSGGRTRRPS